MPMFARGLVGALALLLAAQLQPAVAQTSVTSADIQRLQDRAYEVATDISRLRTRDARTAENLQNELDEIRDEVIYLRVKLRKEGSVPRAEYAELRDRLDDLRSRAQGQAAPAPTPAREPQPATRAPERTETRPETAQNEVPVGQELDVRLQHRLDSNTAQVEDRFEATTVVDLERNGRVLIPAGSVVRGVVSSVDPAGRVDRRGRLTLSFDQITVRGRSYPIRATITQAIESEGIRGETGRIGAGAGVGGVIGGVLGGFRGFLTGILIGAGGTIAATEGKDVVLPQGTILRIRFDSPVTIQ
jgi:gas vesicle protein